MSLWRQYPGDAVRKVMLRRRGEIGTVCIQHDGGAAHVRVCSFLPGVIEHYSSGATPKVVPEKQTWCMSSFAADEVFDKYLGEAYEDLWQNYFSEQHNG